MKKNLLVLGFVLITATVLAQTEKTESWYFKVGGSYFMQTAATEFPTVGGHAPLDKVYQGGNLVSEKSITGSFGEGFRTGLTAGYRFNARVGVEMGVNYYSSAKKTMARTVSDVPITASGVYSFASVGQIRAFDLAPALVLFLGEKNGFEPYTKVGILVPVHGDLEVVTDILKPTSATTVANVRNIDKVLPNPTIGFTASLGTTYKLGKNIAAFAEVEYRNFTVRGNTKETTSFTVNGQDALATRTQAEIHTNYVKKLTTSSNNPFINPTGFDENKATEELGTFVGISGLGLTVGLKYSL